MSIPTNFLTATETQALLETGETTPAQIIKDHQARFNDRNNEVQAWVTTRFDNALAAAGNDETKGLPLHGIVVGVKDIINTKDMPTEHGSTIYKGSQSGVDASIVGLLRAAGAIIIGKTITSEFAAGGFESRPGNPFDITKCVGASSAGSGAAVSDYQCHMALGSQTAASLMKPAGYCGIFGFKPTWNTVCLDGVKSLAPSADTIGILARSIADLKLFAHAIELFKGRPEAISKSINQCKIAFYKTDQFEPEASDDLVNVWEKAQQLLSDKGCIVEEIDLGSKYKGWMGAQGRFTQIVKAEGGVAMKREYVIGKGQMGEGLPEWVDNDINPFVMLKARDELAALRPDFDAIAGQYDAIITPTVPNTAPPVTVGDRPGFNSLFTGLHVPTVHIPGFAGEDGMPMGLTLVGARYKDQDLLEVARVVAEVWIGADGGKLKRVPAPEGTVHVKP